MKIRFFKPFDELSGKEEMDLELKRSLPVKELLGIMAEKMPSFRPYLAQEKDEILNFFVVLIRGDEVLRMQDVIHEEDTIKILPPISGG
jgi:molybdopterin converting factor small subunit